MGVGGVGGWVFHGAHGPTNGAIASCFYRVVSGLLSTSSLEIYLDSQSLQGSHPGILPEASPSRPGLLGSTELVPSPGLLMFPLSRVRLALRTPAPAPRMSMRPHNSHRLPGRAGG